MLTISASCWRPEPKGFAEHTGVDADFVEDNHSRSRKGVLRGLRYQLEPIAQGKLRDPGLIGYLRRPGSEGLSGGRG